MKAFKVKRGSDLYYRVELPQQLSGEGKRRAVMGKTRGEAMEKAQKEVERHARGLDRDAGEKTVEAFLAEFMIYYERDGGIAPSTYQDYRYHVDAHIVPALGKLKLRDLDPRRVDAFTKGMIDKKLSLRTCQYSCAVLRRALQFAVDWKYIPVNPASSRTRAAKRHASKELSKIRYFTPDESRTFVDAVLGDRFEALYVLALTSGMRQGEMLGLQWPDIDLENGKLTIFRALHRTKRRRLESDPDGWFELRHPKTKGSRRTIEIPMVTVESLRRHRESQNELRSLAGLAWEERNLVFTTKVGTPLDTSNVLHHFQRILKSAKLQKMRFYDLRHTHASLLIAAGVHPKKIAERLGHASIKLTMDLYGHLFEGSDRESAERMQRIFGGLSPSPERSVDDGRPFLISVPERRKSA
jgi:integrase